MHCRFGTDILCSRPYRSEIPATTLDLRSPTINHKSNYRPISLVLRGCMMQLRSVYEDVRRQYPEHVHVVRLTLFLQLQYSISGLGRSHELNESCGSVYYACCTWYM